MCALFDIRWVPSGGTRRRAKRRRSFSDPGINCKLVYRPQRTLGCWFIRRVVAAFASSLPPPSPPRPPFNSGSPVPSQEFPQGAPGQRRDTPSRLSSPNGNCRKFHRERILPRLASYRTCSNSAGRDKRPLFLALSVSSKIPRSLLVGARKDSSMIPREFDDFELRVY